MVNHFQQTIHKVMHSLGISGEDHILLGVSGGADSMVLLHVLHALKYKVTAAHINFKLRGEESELDAVHVKRWCEDHAIPFLLLEANAKQYAEENKLNIQQAARQIRYTWWEELREDNSFDYVATAHHLDDNIETFLINLLRGTGMEGLAGIPSESDSYIRPMLELTRREVEIYADDFRIPYRVDSSNLKDDYQRNKIRHHLIPLMEELSPGFSARMKHNLLRLRMEWEGFESSFNAWVRTFITVDRKGVLIKSGEAYPSFLLRWFAEQGVPWNLVYDYVMAENQDPGKVLKHENILVFRTEDGHFVQKVNEQELVEITGPGTYEYYGGTLILQKENQIPTTWPGEPWVEFVSPSVMQFPLYIRRIQPGDAFQPLGMKGHHKKLQDLLVDRKLEMHEKYDVRVLTNQDHIIWVVGMQLDERAKVTKDDLFVYKLEWKEN